MSVNTLLKNPADNWTNLNVNSLAYNPLTTTQRNLLTPHIGQLIFNTTDTSYEGYYNGQWNILGATGGIGPTGPVGPTGNVGPTGAPGLSTIPYVSNSLPFNSVGPTGGLVPITGSLMSLNEGTYLISFSANVSFVEGSTGYAGIMQYMLSSSGVQGDATTYLQVPNGTTGWYERVTNVFIATVQPGGETLEVYWGSATTTISLFLGQLNAIQLA